MICAHQGYYRITIKDPVQCTLLTFLIMWWEWNSNPSTARHSNRIIYNMHRWVTFIRNRLVAVFYCQHSDPRSPDSMHHNTDAQPFMWLMRWLIYASNNSNCCLNPNLVQQDDVLTNLCTSICLWLVWFNNYSCKIETWNKPHNRV